MITDEHFFSVEQVSPNSWGARCICGWTSTVELWPWEAANQIRDHIHDFGYNVCRTCHELKPLDLEHFTKDATVKSGCSNICRECYRAKRMEGYYASRRKTFDKTRKRDDWT